MAKQTTPNRKRTDGPLQSPLYISLVWDKHGKLKPPLSGMHQRLYDRWKVAKNMHDKTGSQEDFRAYMDLNRELGRSITAATARLNQAMRDTEIHRVLANQVDEAKKRWRETKSKDDMERWLDLKTDLEYAVMEEVYDSDGNLI